MDIDQLKTKLASLDPRLYQIASLSTLLLYGLLWLHFDISPCQISSHSAPRCSRNMPAHVSISFPPSIPAAR